MKKIMKLFVLVAAAAMTLASCQKNEITGPVKKEVNFTIKADMAETKTAITDKGDGTYSPTWKGGDKIAVLFSEPTKDCKKDAEFVNANEDGAKAQFEGKHTFETEEGVEEVEGTLYAFYPSSAFNKGYQDGTVRLDLPAVQNPTSTSFDPACDLLVAKPCYYYAAADGDAYDVLVDDMYFARLISVLRINLNSDFLEDEIVKSVSFDADGLRLTGAMAVDPIEGVLVKNNSTTDLSEVQAMYTETDPIAVSGEKNSAYLVVAPVTIPSGTTLTFTIETENYDIVKTINAPADMEMPAGNIAVINLTIKEENCTAKVEDTSDYSGEWLIVNSDLTRAANAWANGNNLPEFELTTNEGVILESDGIANCKMIITKEADGYTIQDASGMYLYAAGASDKNHLYGQETKSYWTIEKNETNYVITSLAKDDRNILRYNSTNKIFSCYSSGQADVTLYKYSEIMPDTNPSISLTKNSDQVAFGATSYEFTYTVKNITGNVAAAIKEGATMTNVSASASNGTVTVTFDANDDAEQKTATIVLSYEGAASQEFVLTQAGKSATVEAGWVLTSFANLKEGDQVVIVSTKNTDTWAMSNNNGTGSAPDGVIGVTYSNDKLTAEPTENIIWYVGVDGNNRIFYKDSDNSAWLYCTGTNNGVRVGTNTAKTFTLEDGYLKHIGTSRYVGVYITKPDWRCYTSNTGNSNIAGQTFQFFVKTGEGSGETPEPTPDPETPDETKYYVKVTTSTPGAGTYLYVLDKGFVFTGDVSDNSWGKSEAVTITDNKIEATEAINAYAITLEEGTTSGQYAVKLPNGNYLVTTTQKPTSSSTASYMTYDTTEGLCSVINSDYYYFHGNTNSNSFRWYKLSSNQNAGQLYKLN